MINRIFRIKDIEDRDWGTFSVEKETVDFLGKKQMHGYLSPSYRFKEVRSRFLKHEVEMSQNGYAEDTNWNEIVCLKPYLIDEVSHEIIDIGDVIFINESLFVTCAIETVS